MKTVLKIIDFESMSHKLYNARLDSGLTCKEFSKHIGISRSTLYRIEDEIGPIAFPTYQKICKCLNVKENYFYR